MFRFVVPLYAVQFPVDCAFLVIEDVFHLLLRNTQHSAQFSRILRSGVAVHAVESTSRANKNPSAVVDYLTMTAAFDLGSQCRKFHLFTTSTSGLSSSTNSG